ncbi:MAG: signal peptide peptidase SppA, partial [Myxococcales bacterium]|nr:signal peptide peptidase SppA [Myxococcales bacterium]
IAQALGGTRHGLDQLVFALERAAHDDRVDGVVARIGGDKHGMATTQEMRDAILRFRGSGKFAVAFAETFGEVGPGNQSYYLATAFDEVWLQPSGDVGLTGLAAEAPFLRGALDKLGATPRMDHRHEYKNAKNMFTERSMTPAHREATTAVMRAMSTQLVAGIAEGRGLEPAKVARIIDGGPYYGEEATQLGLVDHLGYRDQVMDAVRERAGGEAKLLYFDRYLERAGSPYDDGARIALVFGEGSVTRGASSFDPIFGGPTMGSDTVAGALRAAIDDPEVKAILFRVDSPGGSYVASDAIWRETVRAREAGKPVIVSMGDVAGSGGYFVAMDAAKIVAHPGTITGSIGVLGGKVLTRDTWEKVGVTFDGVSLAANATMWSAQHDYTAIGWERFQAWLDRVYEDFTAKVAAGRDMPLGEVRAVAKGRIWAGSDAKERGLVDALGGYAVALELAREAAGLDADAAIELKIYPEAEGPIAKLLSGGPDSSEPPAPTQSTLTGLRELRPAAQTLRQLGFGPGSHGALAMPPVRLVGDE